MTYVECCGALHSGTAVAPTALALMRSRYSADWSRDLRKQEGWDEHAHFMDSLVEEGFIVLGGPLAGDREILHVISAPSLQAVRERLAQDNWHQNGMLTIKSIEPWTILLDSRTT
jgi:uncharacterized protein YciI